MERGWEVPEERIKSELVCKIAAPVGLDAGHATCERSSEAASSLARFHA